MPILDREEYIEQAYLFRVLRERLAEGQATQSILVSLDQEILSTTRLPLAIQFLATELKHTGLLSSGFARLGHYFTAYQAYLIQGSEDETRRFSAETALLALEREAEYRAGRLSPPGLFIYQFEVLCRNRLGYDSGLRAMQQDPFYDADWRKFLEDLRNQLGVIDFADLIYLRSHGYVMEQRRHDPDYTPPFPPLFGEKEGKIARANFGRDPLYLFAALQRQLGYPEIPRPRPQDNTQLHVQTLLLKVRDLEMRLKLLEAEVRGTLDLSKLIDPEKLRQQQNDDW
ncbi:MAG: hypothetical protein ACKO23_10550 [Gemmataceae bacterium]